MEVLETGEGMKTPVKSDRRSGVVWQPAVRGERSMKHLGGETEDEAIYGG